MLDDQMFSAMIIAMTLQPALEAPSNGTATHETAAATSAMFVQSRGGGSTGLGTTFRSGRTIPRSVSRRTTFGTMRPIRPPQCRHGPVWVFETTRWQPEHPHQPIVDPYANFARDL